MLGRHWWQLPRLLRFMIDTFMNGAVMGCVFGLVMIRLDTAGLGTLLEGHGTVGPTALFLGQGALMFGTLGMAVAVITLGAEDG